MTEKASQLELELLRVIPSLLLRCPYVALRYVATHPDPLLPLSVCLVAVSDFGLLMYRFKRSVSS